MRLSSKIAYNAIIQVVGRIIAIAINLIIIAIITRYLGQTGFGQYVTVITFLSFFGILADLGLTLVTVQMISRPDADKNKILGNLLSLRLVSAVIFLGLAPLLIIFFPYEPIVKIGVAAAAASFLFNALNQIFIGLFQTSLRMDKVMIAGIIERVVFLAGVAAIVYLNLGLVWILAASGVSGFLNFGLLYLFSLKFVRIKLRFDWPLWIKIIKMSWPLSLTIVFNLIYLKSDTLLLSLMKTQSEVGIYGASYRVIDVLVSFSFMFAGLILPVLTSAWSKKNAEQFKNILQKSFDVMVIMAVPLIVGAQFTAKPIMLIVAGNDFIDSGPPLKILIAAAGIIFMGNMFAHAIIALNKQKKIIGAYVFTSLTALAGYLIFIPKFSYFGAAWVTVYSELIIALASGYLVWKFTKFLPNLKVFLKSLAASAIMGGVLWALTSHQAGLELNIFLTLLLSASIYFTALFFLKGLTFLSLREIIKLPIIKNNNSDEKNK